MKVTFSALVITAAALVSSACLAQNGGAANARPTQETGLPKIDDAAWRYQAQDGVFYQLGIPYCRTPADAEYETLAIFVPKEYMTATANGDGTFTCKANPSGKIGAYTGADAPVVMPVETPGYSAMPPLTDYADVTEYTRAGFVYAHAGCRGRESGAPAAVADLKAAVRFLRLCDAELPGDSDAIFTFGMSGGGAQSALMGATGDDALYAPYLKELGAVEGVSDAVLGSMCWCPITNLDTADAGYEWMMGSTRTGLSDEERRISDKLAQAFAAYVNRAQIKDPNGAVLTLDESSEGIFQAGGYYDYMKTVVEGSLNNFLADTKFPYAVPSKSRRGPGGFRGGPGARPRSPNGARPIVIDGPSPFVGGPAPDRPYEERDGVARNQAPTGITLTGTYQTAQEYVDALNAKGKWIEYDAASNTAKISSLKDFVSACKIASKRLGAFDQFDGRQAENVLFGYGDGKGAHFDADLAAILAELGNGLADSYKADLAKKDGAGNTASARVAMYTPLYYLLESSEGYKTSSVAKFWRIRTGIAQSDCALATEVNLALALENYGGLSVDFETVWGEGHTKAERVGEPTENFIAWVHDCMKKRN